MGRAITPWPGMERSMEVVMYRKLDVLMWRGLLLSAGAVLAAIAPAWALNGIHTERWSPESGAIRYRDVYGNCTNLSVQFEATVTASDEANGIRFSICERDAGETNDPLLDLVLVPTADRPPVGTHVLALVWFRLGCDDSGRLIGCALSDWHLTWCDPATGTHAASGLGPSGNSFTTDELEDFELVLVGDDGVEGPGPTAENAFQCGSTSVWAPLGSRPAPWRVLAGLPAAESGGPPVISHDPAENGSIGLYFDRSGLMCGGDVVLGVPARLYVVARLAGWTSCGIAGAEFRVVGVPPGWPAVAIPEPYLLRIGDPLAGGVSVGFVCTRGEAGAVPLYMIDVFPTSLVSNYEIGIERRQPVIDPRFPCTLVTLCDFPVFTIVCVEGRPAVVNPSPGSRCEIASVSVGRRSWSQVKALYRE